MWQIAFYVLAMAIPAMALWIYKWRNPARSGRLPPGSMGLPLIGETLQFFVPSKSLDIPPFIKSRIQNYGPVFKTNLVGRPVIMSSDPDFNNFIFQQEGKSVQLWYMDSFSKLLGIGDEATGYVHKYLKKVISEQFGPEKLKHKILSELEQITDKTLSSWTQKESVDIKCATSTMVLNYVSKQLFDYDPEKYEENLNDFNLIKAIMSFPLNVPGTAFYNCLQKHKKFMKMMKDIIEERLQHDTSGSAESKERYDFLDHLIDEMKYQSFLTQDFIARVIFALTFAAIETIPATLTLTIKLLNEHPLVLQELLKEHEELLKRKEDAKRGLTWDDYKSMNFTMQVINESLRMATVASGMLRKTTKDIHVNGYMIPEGWTIMVVPSAIHLNPETYKNPLEFNPWRWKELGSNIKGRHFLPFGGGLRSCPGADFSKVLMAVFLHILLTKYRWNKVKEDKLARTPVLDFGDGYYISVNKK